MKCHYEVLEISREADNNEIKTAYRKLALKWHPDKNLDDPDLAKEQFQIVQQAYEVLSDPQERAWYDNHREQILFGANSEFQDNSLDLFQYFTTTCFKGYGDDDGGFYQVYGKVFSDISKEDMKFMEDKEEFCEVPLFGNSLSDYESVKNFYDYWMSYSTKKSYSWLDPYDVREGKGDRRLLKLIEKENKKVRLKARKERNEEIRNLVAFVRKRDKRMQALKKELEAKTMENRKKQEEISKQKRLERNKTLFVKESQPGWQQVQSELEEIEKHLSQEFGNAESDEENEDLGHLYCVACNKLFKNPRAFKNHELSKKHKDNVSKLKQTMLEEEEQLDELECSNVEDVHEEIEIEISESSLEEEEEKLSNNKKTKKKKNKKKKIQNITENHLDEENQEQLQSLNAVESDLDFSKKNEKKKNKKKSGKVKAASETKKIDNIEEEAKSVSTRKQKKANEISEKLKSVDVNNCCLTCKASFPSKNKLFQHLKKNNHGVLIP
ncbi:hypothetical protein ABEB36_006691 [Hypothenemus hampei]|uniref:DnaJ homolog subfamily C member 21 n=1 Tax=Hypothenemus hampei TaxID=57062 RepID=A0ABD1ETN6_HYPHA